MKLPRPSEKSRPRTNRALRTPLIARPKWLLTSRPFNLARKSGPAARRRTTSVRVSTRVELSLRGDTNDSRVRVDGRFAATARVGTSAVIATANPASRIVVTRAREDRVGEKRDMTRRLRLYSINWWPGKHSSKVS
jgi:hypothetical protein